MEILSIQAKIRIVKPAREVYEAIVEPKKMRNYFISSGSARMEDNSTVIWKFPEFDSEIPVSVKTVKPDQYVSFSWDAGDYPHLVEIFLEEDGNAATVVTVTEKEEPNNDVGIKWLKENTEGWANFLACLKAYLEYGINLRKGAFDFMRTKVQDQ